MWDCPCSHSTDRQRAATILTVHTDSGAAPTRTEQWGCPRPHSTDRECAIAPVHTVQTDRQTVGCPCPHSTDRQTVGLPLSSQYRQLGCPCPHSTDRQTVGCPCPHSTDRQTVGLPLSSQYRQWDCPCPHSTDSGTAPVLTVQTMGLPLSSQYRQWDCPCPHSTDRQTDSGTAPILTVQTDRQTDNGAAPILTVQTNRQTDRQWGCPYPHSTDRQTDNGAAPILTVQTDRQTDRQTDNGAAPILTVQTDRQTMGLPLSSQYRQRVWDCPCPHNKVSKMSDTRTVSRRTSHALSRLRRDSACGCCILSHSGLGPRGGEAFNLHDPLFTTLPPQPRPNATPVYFPLPSVCLPFRTSHALETGGRRATLRETMTRELVYVFRVLRRRRMLSPLGVGKGLCFSPKK